MCLQKTNDDFLMRVGIIKILNYFRQIQINLCQNDICKTCSIHVFSKVFRIQKTSPLGM